MFQEIKYNALYLVYDKFSHLWSLVNQGVYLPRYNKITIRLHKDDIKASTNKKDTDYLIREAELKEREINYLLNNKFLFGPARWLSLFPQTSLRYISHELRIEISTYEDLERLLKIVFMLSRQKGYCDKLFPRIDTDNILEDIILNLGSFKNINISLANSINNLNNSNKYVYVLGMDDRNIISLYRINAASLYKILYNHNLVCLYGDLKSINIKPVVIKNSEVVEKKEDISAEHLESELQEIQNSIYNSNEDIIYCLDIDSVQKHADKLFDTKYVLDNADNLSTYLFSLHNDAKTISCIWHYNKDLVKLLGPNFKTLPNVLLPHLFAQQNHCLSDFVNNITENETLPDESSPDKFIHGVKSCDLSLNLYSGSQGQNISFSTPWWNLEFGIALQIFSNTSNGSSLAMLQDIYKHIWFSGLNTSFRQQSKKMNKGFLSYLLTYWNVLDSFFNKTYVHGFSSKNKIGISYNTIDFLSEFFKFYIIVYDVLVKKIKIGKLSKSLEGFITHNTIFNISRFSPVIIDEDNYMSSIPNIDYTDEELATIFGALQALGHGRTISFGQIISNLGHSVFRELLSTMYLLIRHKFTKNHHVELKYGLRQIPFTSIIIGKTGIYSFLDSNSLARQIIFEPKCFTSTKYNSLIYGNSYVVFNFICDSILDTKTYLNSILSCSYTQAYNYLFSLSSTPFLSARYLRDYELGLIANIYNNNLNNENNTSLLLVMSKKVGKNDSFSFGAGLAQCTNGDRMDIKIMNANNSKVSFLSNNFMYILYNTEEFMQMKCDLMWFINYIKHLNNSIIELTGYLDVLVCKDNLKHVFDFEIKYIYKLITVWGRSIGLVITCALFRDNYSPISLTII